ncbi:hypothetical protein NMY22_g13532 [Coprinellus aureogranulatus]|nr:hypothetical protein NMY22_g13532 [Coprinellus aureogranulatus]
MSCNDPQLVLLTLDGLAKALSLVAKKDIQADGIVSLFAEMQIPMMDASDLSDTNDIAYLTAPHGGNPEIGRSSSAHPTPSSQSCDHAHPVQPNPAQRG